MMPVGNDTSVSIQGVYNLLGGANTVQFKGVDVIMEASIRCLGSTGEGL